MKNVAAVQNHRSERRHLQASVVAANRENVAALVRRTVAPRHREEAEQVGAIGILVALEKHDPSGRVPFRRLALQHARGEIQAWMDHGVFWRPRDPAGVISEAEGAARVREFTKTLSPADRSILLRKRSRSPRYATLVERCRAFVRR